MNKLAKKLILLTSVFLALNGCNSSNKTPAPTPSDPPAPPPPAAPPIVANQRLQLDFALPLSELGVAAGTLAGATLNLERGEFVVLGERGSLVYMSPQGTISEETEIERANSATYTGIEYIGSGGYVVSTSDSKIMRLDEETRSLEDLAQLDFNVDAVAYDEVSGSAVVIDDGSPSRIVSISLSGSLSESIIESEIADNSVKGLTLSDGVLLIASVAEASENSLIISSSMSGKIGTVWALESVDTSGLVLLDPEAPEILTANSDSNQTIMLFEAPTPPSIPSEEVLILNSSPELDFDQPSGIDFTQESSELYYVTDFGEVRKGIADGSNELLFEIDVMQGSFEAIVHIASTDAIALMMSDDSNEQNRIITFDIQGNQQSIFTVPVIDSSHQFESMDYHSNTETYFAVTASEGQKTLYEMTVNGTTTTNLSDEYDGFIIGGIAMTQDGANLYLITEEWEDGSQVLMAGLLIKVDLLTNTELARYSLASDIDGEVQGIKAPSDVAIDEVNNLIFVTSDIDDSILYVFEGF